MTDPAGWEPIFRAIPGITLALAGAVVRLLNSTAPQTFRSYMAALATAGFAGTVLAYFLEGFDWTVHFKTFALGITGYCARDFVAVMSRWWLSAVKRMAPIQSDVAHGTPMSNIPPDATDEESSGTLPMEPPATNLPPPRVRRDARDPRMRSGEQRVRRSGEHRQRPDETQ